MSRQVIVEIIGDAGQFTKTFDGAVNHAQAQTSKWSAVGTGIKVGIGIGVTWLATQGTQAVLDFAGTAQQAFRDDQLSAEMLGQALLNNIPAWDGNTAAVEAAALAAERFGFADDAARDAMAQLVGVTHDQDEAIKLLSLSIDLARAKNVDLATAADIVTKAHEGNGKALKALGIDIEGVTTAAGLLDAVQKNVAGSAEVWAATSEGRVAASQQKVQEATEKVGGAIDRVTQIVLPPLADGLSFALDKAGDLAEGLSGLLGPAFDALAGIVTGTVMPAFGHLQDFSSNVFDTFFVRPIQLGLDLVQAAFRETPIIAQKALDALTEGVRGAVNVVIGLVNGMIGLINGLQIHFGGVDTPFGKIASFDWGGLNLPTIPYLHGGGIVPGSPGSDVPIMAQAGERVIPAGVSPAINLTFNVSGPSDPESFAREALLTIRRELDRQGMTLA